MTVVSLARPEAHPNADVIEAAEELLALALSGDIDGVVWAAGYTDDRTGQSRHSGKVGPSLIGTLTLAHARVVQRALA